MVRKFNISPFLGWLQKRPWNVFCFEGPKLWTAAEGIWLLSEKVAVYLYKTDSSQWATLIIHAVNWNTFLNPKSLNFFIVSEPNLECV